MLKELVEHTAALTASTVTPQVGTLYNKLENQRAFTDLLACISVTGNWLSIIAKATSLRFSDSCGATAFEALMEEIAKEVNGQQVGL